MQIADRAAEAFARGVRAISSPVVARIAAFNRWRLPPRDAPHPLLTGLNEPMREELTLSGLTVTGTIPPELDGRYVRIGPNPAKPDPRTYHFFTGDGMLHGVRIGQGRAAWYRNRWIRSTDVARARGFAPAPGPRHIFDTVNTSVIGHAGAAYALVEAGSTPVRFSETLEDQRYVDFDGTLPGSFSAHPRRDPLTGELHAICYEATEPSRVHYTIVGRDGRVRRSLAIPVRDGPLVHDCAITSRYVLIFDMPLTLSLKVVLSGHGFPYRWNRRHPARLGLLPRDGEAQDIVWIALDPCFIFHTANAHDLADGRVVLDAIVYPAMFGGDNDAPDILPRGFERWTIDPAAGSIEIHVLDATPQEFPVIDDRQRGLAYRYAYTLGLANGLMEDTPLIKHDFVAGACQQHAFGSGRTPGEFVFVPRNAEGEEDDGWLLGLVINADQRSTDLEILDARHFDKPPIASIHLPHRVPPGIHGAWLPAE